MEETASHTLNAAARNKRRLSTMAWTVIVAAFLVGAASGFVGGFGIAKTTGDDATSTEAQMGRGAMRGGFAGSFGTVTKISGSSISMEDQREGTVTNFAITSSTTITNNGSSASASDIAIGDTVMIQADSSDASTARTIIINPSMPSGGSSQQPSDQMSDESATDESSL